jgi:hypothetical protein
MEGSKMVKRRAAAIAFVCAVMAVAIGCNKDRLEIGKLVRDPDRYYDKTVQVAGEVTRSYSTNLILAEFGAYQLDDGTGRVWVVSRNGVPRDGAKVGVKGKVSSGLKIGGEVLGVLLREEERAVK